MHKDAGEKGEVKNEKEVFLLTVAGGATITNLLMQIQVRVFCYSLIQYISASLL